MLHIRNKQRFMQLMHTMHNVCVEELLKKKDAISDEEIIENVRCIAQNTHTFNGLFQDYRIEELLIAIGQRRIIPHPTQKHTSCKKILHVATKTYSVGGHTRVIVDWMRTDIQHEQTLFLIEQNTLDSNLQELFRGLHVYYAQQKDYISKAQELQDYSSQYDLVILHTHIEDPVPLLAFSTPNNIPVFIYNHADHLFWLGASIADLVIDISNSDRTTRYRNAVEQFWLPFHVEDTKVIDKVKAKKRIGISKDTLVITSMAREGKFEPTTGQYYMRDIVVSVIRQHPNVIYFLIGVSEKFFKKYIMPTVPDNVKCIGYLLNPTSYLEASDIYIESFPEGSGLSTTETMRCHVAPLFNDGLKGNPTFSVCKSYLVGEQIKSLATSTPEEYQQTLERLITDSAFRKQYATIATECVDLMNTDSYLNNLQKLYTKAENTTHKLHVTNKLNYDEEWQKYENIQKPMLNLKYFKFPLSTIWKINIAYI